MGKFLSDAEIRGFQNRIHELEMALAETEALEISHGERIEKQAKRIKELETQLEKNNPLLDEAADKIDALEETIAAQAVVIEKLRSVLEKLACLGNGDEHGNSIGNCIAIEALSIPTDSKEVLKEWLDEVLGEPVGYMSNESAYRLKHGGNSKGAVPVHLTPSSVSKIPLFRKPEVK